MSESFQIVNQTVGPPPKAWTRVFAYDASSQLEYQGWADSNQPWTEWGIGTGLTSIVDSSNTATVTFSAAHGLEVGHQVEVLGASDADLNTVYVVATVADTTHITFTTASVTDATYNTGQIRIRSRAPRKNAAIWVIQKNVYASGLLTDQKWAKGRSVTPNLVWDDRASYDYR